MAHTSRLKRGVVPVMGGTELFSRAGTMSKPQCKYTFDGATSYVSIPNWKPLGVWFDIEYWGRSDLGGVNNGALGRGGSFPRSRWTPVNGVQWGWSDKDGDAVNLAAVSAPYVVGKDYKIMLEATQGSVIVRSRDYSETAAATLDGRGGVIAFIGRAEGTNYFNGAIWGVRFTDLAPIQDTTGVNDSTDQVCMIPEWTATGDFIISCDLRREQVGSGALTHYVTRGTVSSGFDYRGKLNPTQPDRVRLQFDDLSDVVFESALSKYAEEEHLRMRVERIGDDVSLYLNDELVSTLGGHAGKALTLDRISGVTHGAIMQNIRIATAGDVRHYVLDETSGLDAFDSESGQHGVWDLEPTRTYVPSNSRFYPMDDNEAVVRDALGDGSTDGVIVNYDPAGWSCPATPAAAGAFQAAQLDPDVVGYQEIEADPWQLPRAGGAVGTIIGTLDAGPGWFGVQVAGDPGQNAFTTVTTWEAGVQATHTGHTFNAADATYENGLWVWSNVGFSYEVDKVYYVLLT